MFKNSVSYSYHWSTVTSHPGRSNRAILLYKLINLDSKYHSYESLVLNVSMYASAKKVMNFYEH